MSGRIENLKPWRKGESGNPGGRPKTKPLTSELERLLELEAPKGKGQAWATVIAEALLKKARKGDVRAIAEVANRVEGKPFQSVLVDVEPANRLAGLSDMELEETQEAIERLERELGYAPSEGPISVAQ